MQSPMTCSMKHSCMAFGLNIPLLSRKTLLCREDNVNHQRDAISHYLCEIKEDCGAVWIDKSLGGRSYKLVTNSLEFLMACPIQLDSANKLNGVRLNWPIIVLRPINFLKDRFDCSLIGPKSRRILQSRRWTIAINGSFRSEAFVAC